MLIELLKFFAKRKYEVVRFGEVRVEWKDSGFTVFSVIFLENGYGKRKWTASGGKNNENFNNTSYYAPCETWVHTGLFPDWAKDAMAEKLMR